MKIYCPNKITWSSIFMNKEQIKQNNSHYQLNVSLINRLLFITLKKINVNGTDVKLDSMWENRKPNDWCDVLWFDVNSLSIWENSIFLWTCIFLFLPISISFDFSIVTFRNCCESIRKICRQYLVVDYECTMAESSGMCVCVCAYFRSECESM